MDSKRKHCDSSIQESSVQERFDRESSAKQPYFNNQIGKKRTCDKETLITPKKLYDKKEREHETLRRELEDSYFS